MTESPNTAEAPIPIAPRIIERPRESWQSYLLAGVLRTIGRPLGNAWPHRPWPLDALDHVLRWTGRVVGGAHGRALDVADVPVLLVRAPSVLAPRLTILHFHGGGFAFGSPDMYRDFAVRLSAAADAEVVLFDYRHPPRATVENMAFDCLAVYRWALQRDSARPLVVSGDSAGANLAFTTLVAARDAGLALPVAILGQSAWLDVEHRHPPDAARDAFFSLSFATRSARMLRGGAELPLAVRPLEADLRGLPPVLLQAGAEEPVRAGNEQMAAALGAAGVAAELQLWRHQVHVFQAFAGVLPEGRRAFADIASFLDRIDNPGSHR